MGEGDHEFECLRARMRVLPVCRRRCYLNSLLQTLFMCPELRCALLNWTYDESTAREPRAECLPYQLQRIFVRMQTLPCACRPRPRPRPLLFVPRARASVARGECATVQTPDVVWRCDAPAQHIARARRYQQEAEAGGVKKLRAKKSPVFVMPKGDIEDLLVS